MTEEEKAMLKTLVRATENLVMYREAVAEAVRQKLASRTLEIFLSCSLSDPTILFLTRAKFRRIYDEIENAPDVSTVVQSLLKAFEQNPAK